MEIQFDQTYFDYHINLPWTTPRHSIILLPFEDGNVNNILFRKNGAILYHTTY